MIGRHKHCIALEDFSREEILEVIDLAASMKEVLQRPIKKVPSLRGKMVVNLFFEASTRTRSSFETAAKILSADALNWTSSSSSVTKGETLVDTAKNLEAMRPDVLVIRHSAGGAPRLVAEHVGCSVVSAGDGAHEHPSQGLLDCFTLREKLGTLEGKTVAIVGDVSHSRVARSDLHAFPKLGAKVRLCGPPTMMPAGVERLGATVHTDLREAVDGADAVIMLRIQHERIGDPLIPGTREYSKVWGLNAKKAADWLKPSCVILHPGPINRGVELSPEVADGPRSVILDQVQNGVAVRMAILYLLAGGAGEEARA
ncbi:aspartate carbamoyltransferase [Anaeromyxobacter dehalogenans 2CP-1]|uniref:Aspartate carbamoyltransferase catalytic subunit n=1 Tax=Anaeromyxobacter dehalogenans (strain ATCC BAA-258 / DSM 21875 / 2CP-1) TaxID=455488 RepID=PYRB_ANAD2|nr:aspartate carbamoyltransferase catalytic subunit [Anaeromyxobacter dehalogenans]B8JAE9.1 RecName: Full=Aspartate carbamoyltransferase catalytic subunit; AltName: Full=Aspartate transcarbamylase; Short=ATCase [Anaeromyxobacter dehalogenans 2CP-1]ACL65668.1 aspartate carbamoyltransferase [Anaeromyxobacter dehalogenans 2CP-1]